jgi:hypothetical protein
MDPPYSHRSLIPPIQEWSLFRNRWSRHPYQTYAPPHRWAYNIIEKTGRFDIACREWRQMDPNTKDWSFFKRHFKAADKDLRHLDTTGTDGFHGSAHSVQTTNTLLTTTQADLAASELALARALAQVSLSSESTAASAANISATTPATSGERPRGYC